MLSGFRPFGAIHTLTTLVYAHMAVLVPPLHCYKELEIPIVVGNIVSKLLEKDPNLRYQSAAGLMADLRQASQYLNHIVDKRGRTLSLSVFEENLPESTEAQMSYLRVISKNAKHSWQAAPESPMVFGNQDKCSMLRAPHTMFGREDELAQILQLWKRTAEQSATIFITGYSGLGKS